MNYDLASLAAAIADQTLPVHEREIKLNEFQASVHYAFLQQETLPDCKAALEIFTKIANNRDENFHIRRLVLKCGIEPLIATSANAFRMASKNGYRGVIELVRNQLIENIGDPDLLLSQILNIAEDHGTSPALRNEFANSANIVHQHFTKLIYTTPQDLQQRFARLEVL